jgi:fructokinase
MIVTCGEALVDFVALPSSEPRAGGGRAFLELLGGSPYNVARGVGRLGSPAGFAGAISTDFFGDELVAGLADCGVTLDRVQRLDRPTTLSFVRLDGGGPSYAFYSAESADRHFSADPDVLLAGLGALHVGSNSLVLEPAATAFERLAAAAAARGALVSLDPNVRPRLVADRRSYLERLDRLVRIAGIVKLSDEDLDFIEPGAAPGGAAERLLGAGAALVVVTSGAGGARAWTASGTASVVAPEVDVVDTIGAGDGFTAGLLARLDEHGRLSRAAIAALSPGDLDALLRFAAAVAATVCTRRGADMPTREEVAALGLL